MRRNESLGLLVALLLAACGGKPQADASAPPTAPDAASAVQDAAPPSPPEAEPDASAAVDEAGLATDVATAMDVPAAVEVDPAAEVPADAALSRNADGALLVPLENLTQGTRPGMESAEELARALLAAIVADDPASAGRTVFPAAAFEILKDLPEPLAYHRRMVRWYEEDLHAEHERLGAPPELAFERFQLGRCTWQAPHTEGNLLAYWSCRRNRIFARAGTRPVEVELRVMINWGDRWYVAHLAPVRH